MLRWRSFPVVDECPKSILLTVLPVGIVILFYFAFRDIILVCIALLFLFMVLREYYLPTFFTLDDHGIKIDRLLDSREYKWDQIARCRIHKDGVYLILHGKPAYKGVFIRFNKNNSRVAEFISSKIAN